MYTLVTTPTCVKSSHKIASVMTDSTPPTYSVASGLRAEDDAVTDAPADSVTRPPAVDAAIQAREATTEGK